MIITAVLYLILTIPVLPVLTLIGKKNPAKKDRIVEAMIRWIFRVLLFEAGTNVTVIGEERIPHDTSVLYAGNHRSIFDIVLTYTHCYGTTGYVAKKSLGQIPLFRTWENYVHCLFFNRDNLKEGMQMILDGIKMLKEGISIFIFPEGTRNKNETDTPLLPFHEGSFRMATKSKKPIVPVAVNNSVNIFERHFPWVRRTNVVVEFCDPIYPDDIPKEQKKHVGEIVSGVITKTIEKNQKLLS